MKFTSILKASSGAFKRTGSFKPKFNGNNNNYGRKGTRFGNKYKNNNEDKELLERTRGRKIIGDGCMGETPYNVDIAALKAMSWTDLIPSSSTSTDDLPSGVSPVPTKELSNKQILPLPLVNSLIHNRKFDWLTPVQAQTILPILRDESVVVRAKTGTGKTAAFAIPILHKVLESKKDPSQKGKVSALIVSPTRELAQQIADEIFKITQFGGLNHIKVQSLVGGISKDRQLKEAALDSYSDDSKVSDIIVATPGRLLDVLGDEGVAERFSNLKFRVFDEADRILDIGFEREMEQVREIIDEASGGKEIPLLLFSATADRTMRSFAQRQFGDRVKVVDTVPKNEPSANELVEQFSVTCPTWADVYESASKEIVRGYEKAKEDSGHFKAIVFLPTTVMVDHYERVLKNIFGRQSTITSNIMGIHGQRKQQSRQVRADKFRKERDAILITTDVVARGMDFPKVTHVFQLGPPPDVSSYIHRIGRTARIGNSGVSHLYFTNHLRGFIDALGREKIKTSLSIYQEDPEFKEKLQEAFNKSIRDEEEAQELVGSLMSYMTVLKNKFNVQAREFLKDMQPFVELVGLTQLKLGAQQRQSWKTNTYSKRQDGYGSSRKTRMRW